MSGGHQWFAWIKMGASYPQPPPLAPSFLAALVTCSRESLGFHGMRNQKLPKSPGLKRRTDFMANRLQTFCQNRSKSFKVPKIYQRSQPFPLSKLPPWDHWVTEPLHPEARLETLRGRRTFAGSWAALGQGCQSGAPGRSAGAAPGK